MSIHFVTDPPGVEITYNGNKLTGAGSDFQLPWGPAQLVARHPRLGSITTNLDIKLEGPNPTPEFKFEYANLIATNLDENVTIKEAGVIVPFYPRGNDKVAYEKPGTHVYDVFWGGQLVDTVTNLIARGLNAILHSERLGREWENGLSMRLVKVPDLLGPGVAGWVGKAEVTRAQFQRVMALANDNPNAAPELPVANISWVQATNFCDKLTSQDQRKPPDYAGRYFLPTIEQWRKFSAGADMKAAVYATNNAAPVGSKGACNVLGIYDALGNVKEWLASADPKDKDVIGGSFRSRPSFGGMASFTNAVKAQFDQPFDDVGFRVIYVPAR